jgi:hypothetical protein
MTPALRLLVREVAEAYSISPELLARKRVRLPKRAAGAKSLCYFIAHDVLKMRHAEIGRQFGLSDHKPAATACTLALRVLARSALARGVYDRVRENVAPYLLLEELRGIGAEMGRLGARAHEIAELLGVDALDEREVAAAE